MNKNLTELVFILDKSGSMHGLEKDTIGGFNSMLEKQREKEGECYVSTVLFSSGSTVLHDRVPISEMKALTADDYQVGGNTALIDAIGGAVHHIKNVHRYIRPEDVPDHTLFVIMTDGMENASRMYSSENVKRMVEQQKEIGWEFLFIGANIDAVETASHVGIDARRSANYHSDGSGTRVVFEAVSEALCCFREVECMPDNWNEKIQHDFESRK